MTTEESTGIVKSEDGRPSFIDTLISDLARSLDGGEYVIKERHQYPGSNGTTVLHAFTISMPVANSSVVCSIVIPVMNTEHDGTIQSETRSIITNIYLTKTLDERSFLIEKMIDPTYLGVVNDQLSGFGSLTIKQRPIMTKNETPVRDIIHQYMIVVENTTEAMHRAIKDSINEANVILILNTMMSVYNQIYDVEAEDSE